LRLLNPFFRSAFLIISDIFIVSISLGTVTFGYAYKVVCCHFIICTLIHAITGVERRKKLLNKNYITKYTIQTVLCAHLRGEPLCKD
jgi:hypothetical protein